MSQLLEVFGRLHPVVLHLPMGMLFGLGVFEFMAWRKGKEAAPRFWISLSACCAAFAAGSGLMLHQEPGYVEDSVMEFHERLGIATAVGAILCAMSYNHLSRYRKILALTVAAMLGAGHFGGTMTHGDGFLFKPLRPEPEKVIATVSYEQDIAPIFDAKCGKCHSARKQKGELRLDTPEWILKGGEEMGAAVNAGQPDGHAILERMLLDLQDEDHMPPEGKKQLTEPEMELVKEWLLLGAPFGKPLSAADPAALKTLKDNLIHVQTVSMDSNELYVDFAATAGEIDAQFVIEMLAPIKENIVELSLARAEKIGDDIVEFVTQLPRLEVLSLVGTAITKASEDALKAIPVVHIFDTELQPIPLDGSLSPELLVAGTTTEFSSDCPVTGKIVNPKYTIVYEGKQIQFCCPNCPKTFWESPSKYLETE